MVPLHVLSLTLLASCPLSSMAADALRGMEEDQAMASMSTAYQSNLADLWEPYDRSRDVPYFWQIPKAGTTNALAYLSTCMDLVKATRVGQKYGDQTELEVVDFDGHKYMNVDTSTVPGLKGARILGLEKSNVVDVVTSGYITAASEELFSAEHRGRMFALFRHPVDRLSSIFYYLQQATWEPTYHPEFADWSMMDYVNSGVFEADWTVRMITNTMSGPLERSHLDSAKLLLRTKCLVGVQSEMNESLDRFQKFFGWDLKDTERNGILIPGEICKEKFFFPEKSGGMKMNTNKHPKILPGSPEYEAILKKSPLDLELYEYVIELFKEQAVIVDE
jgi:hypothetical protein